MVLQLKEKSMVPAICFQLDSIQCRMMYEKLLKEIEEAEAAKYPAYRASCEEAYAKWQVENEKLIKMKEKLKEEETKDIELSSPPDPHAPHPHFVLTGEKNRIGAREFDEIRNSRDLRQELDLRKDAEGTELHPLIRGLQRGVAIYTADGSLANYQRLVQGLAQRGMLGIVFSDASLAYGVNMPFRACCFCGDTPGLFNPLMAQQMGGRAGRRGLDREGHIAYAGLSWGRVKGLMRGTLPNLYGVEPRYPTACLQAALSNHVGVEKSVVMLSKPLAEFTSTEGTVTEDLLATHGGGADAAMVAEASKTTEVAKTEADVVAEDEDEDDAAFIARWSNSTIMGVDYLESSQRWMASLGLINKETGLLEPGKRAMCTMLWELRDHMAESVALVQLYPHMIARFAADKNESQQLAGLESTQTEFLAIFCRVVGLSKCPDTGVPMHEYGYYVKRKKEFDSWTEIIETAQAAVAEMPLEMSLLGYNKQDGRGSVDAVAADPMTAADVERGWDSTLFGVCVSNSAATASAGMPSLFLHQLKGRLFHMGSVLRIMHNTCMMDKELDDGGLAVVCMETLVRKCFMRIRYILRDMEV
jgi:hypothetical protein